VERTLNNILGPHKSTARYGLKDTEVFETEEDSASYPGVRTVYRKELVKVHLAVSPGYSLSFVDEQGTRRFLSWWSTSECRGIQLNAPDEPEGFSSLVPAPVGIDEDELRLFLRSGGVDLSDVGRPLEDLSAELVRGECALRRRPDGGVLRVVDVIMLKLERVDTGEILIQTGEVSTCGQEGPARNLLPSGKRRPDENQFDAAKRILTSSLKIDENYINFDLNKATIAEEEGDSPSYPGLRTLYRKRIISAEVLDQTPLRIEAAEAPDRTPVCGCSFNS
jgi:hypothetical protein